MWPGSPPRELVADGPHIKSVVMEVHVTLSDGSEVFDIATWVASPSDRLAYPRAVPPFRARVVHQVQQITAALRALLYDGLLGPAQDQ